MPSGTDAGTPQQVARFLERYPDLLLVARGADQELGGYIIGGGRGNPEFDLDAPVGWLNCSPWRDQRRQAVPWPRSRSRR